MSAVVSVILIRLSDSQFIKQELKALVRHLHRGQYPPFISLCGGEQVITWRS